MATALALPRLKVALLSPEEPLKRSAIGELPKTTVPEPVIVPVKSKTWLPPLIKSVKSPESLNVAIPLPLLPLPVMEYVPVTVTFGKELAVATVTLPVLLSVNVPPGIEVLVPKLRLPLFITIPPPKVLMLLKVSAPGPNFVRAMPPPKVPVPEKV